MIINKNCKMIANIMVGQQNLALGGGQHKMAPEKIWEGSWRAHLIPAQSILLNAMFGLPKSNITMFGWLCHITGCLLKAL